MANSLPNKLYSCEQTRQLDQLAINEGGIAGIVLMKRAGRAAFEYACQTWPENKNWVVFCGGGNNGGDGYVFAALAAQRAHQVRVFTLADPKTLKGEAALAFAYTQQESVHIEPFQPDSLADSESTVIIDALLGTGALGQVRDDYVSAINTINASGLPVFSLDVPSGLNADTGAVLGCAVRATATMAFIGCNLGLLTGAGPAHAGSVIVDDLAIQPELYDRVTPSASNVNHSDLKALLPKRAVDAHKGLFGHVMVIGGDRGFGGAAIMAAEAAISSGSGLVSLATQAEHVGAALTRRPEVMTIGVPSGQELEPYLARPSVLVVGPGLGQTPWSEQMLQQALISNKPLVLDADALNILAKGRIPLPTHQQWILTPHPGEAARLLGITVAQVQEDRFAAVKAIQQKWGGVVVLKGLGTLIYDGESLVVAKVGNPGLAVGGTGDVLSGLMGSLLAQGLPLMQASQLAVCIHGEAADIAVEQSGVTGLLASELAPIVRKILNS